MHLLYLLGEPGSGKSAVLNAILGYLEPGVVTSKPFAHAEYHRSATAITYLGKADPLFPGTDRLSMAALPIVEAWLRAQRPEVVLGEGDRLANNRFFREARNLGYTLSLAHLSTPLAAARRLARGTMQDPGWVRSRITKHLTLAQEWDALCVDSSGTVEATLRALAALPALRELRIP